MSDAWNRTRLLLVFMESIGMPDITMSIGYQWFRIPMPEITMPEITMDTSDRQLPVVQTNPHTPLPKPGRATEVGEQTRQHVSHNLA